MLKNRFATLVDARGFAKLDENKYKRRRQFFEDNKATQKYLVVKRIDDEQKSFNGVSPFLIEKGLSMITSHIKETQRLRSGDLLILTSKEEGYQQLIRAVKLADMPIKVEEHKFLNLSKGVIYSRDLMMVKEDEIAKELVSQKVIKVERIKRKVQNELKDTPLHILTFNLTELPEYIKAGFLRLDVRTYFPNPMRCHTCQRYGHTKARCERVPVCPKCAQCIPNGHDKIPCEPIQCLNCKSDHTTFDQKCPTFQMEKAIIKIKTLERITYFRAKEMYFRENANTTGATMSGQPKKLYSDVLQQNAENRTNINQNNNNNKNNGNNNNNNNSTNRNINSKNNENNNNENNDNDNSHNNNGNKNNNETVKNINQNKINNNNNTINKNSNEKTIETKKQKVTTERVEEPTTSSVAAANRIAGTTTQPRRYSFLNANELSIAQEDYRMGE